jgi:hypothetical protein
MVIVPTIIAARLAFRRSLEVVPQLVAWELGAGRETGGLGTLRAPTGRVETDIVRCGGLVGRGWR